ncbi:hypothetical protein [Cohnella nanjingensis]|uniref:Uncharacterized protein n=1 Tax=Cohnella nanjingensis TaxID=1387779 RepID=A0A7X0VGM8_9BACL|nr:hypothetical protein [Cohnella nanjingensis]MBB6673016.1 hypothetical protein [Cohnella nanjingensis]
MRNGIRQRLLTAVPGITDVYEPHAADADSVKPYLVITQGEDSEESDWAGFRRIIEIWPVVDRTSFAEVDKLAKQIQSALDEQLLADPDTSEVFTCSYIGSNGADEVDTEWNAITRGLRFAVYAIQPVGLPELAVDDPWLEALAVWTEQQLGADWTVYRGLWPPGYTRPSVLWRIAGMETGEVAAAAIEVRMRFVGHVLGTSQTETNAALVLLPWKLQTSVKIPLDLADRRYLQVINPAADHKADALTGGQLSVTLKRKVARPADFAPLMAQIYSTGKLE